MTHQIFGPERLPTSSLMNDKTELAVFETWQQLNKLKHPHSIKSGEELVFPLDKIRNLGEILDPHLRLHLHINNIKPRLHEQFLFKNKRLETGIYG